MKKLLLFLLSALLGSQVLCQEKYGHRITYEMVLNFDGHQVYGAELFVGQLDAMFLYKLNDTGFIAEVVQSEVGHDGAFSFDLVDTTQYFIVSDWVGKSIIHKEQIPGEQRFCLVEEQMPVVQWQMTGESRMIQGFSCDKATGSFAGRHYTVWFTDQLPVRFGPWKLHGLPGLILEAYDDDREVEFYAKTIAPYSGLDSKLDDFLIRSQMAGYSVMDRVEYNNKFKVYLDNLGRRMVTKFGRGFQVKVSSSDIKTIERNDL